MKFSLSSVAKSILALGAFAHTFGTTIKIDSNQASINTPLVKNTPVTEAPLTIISQAPAPSFDNTKSQLTNDFKKFQNLTSNTTGKVQTFAIDPKIYKTSLASKLPSLSYSFGGENANAWVVPVFVGGYRIWKVYDERNVIYKFPDAARISWGAASDICNQSSGNLIWKDGLKTCMRR
jgi:hypothetical protein